MEWRIPLRPRGNYSIALAPPADVRAVFTKLEKGFRYACTLDKSPRENQAQQRMAEIERHLRLGSLLEDEPRAIGGGQRPIA
jgi:hypothetical protein